MELLLLVFIISVFTSFYCKLRFGSPLKESWLFAVGWRTNQCNSLGGLRRRWKKFIFLWRTGGSLGAGGVSSAWVQADHWRLRDSLAAYEVPWDPPLNRSAKCDCCFVLCSPANSPLGKRVWKQHFLSVPGCLSQRMPRLQRQKALGWGGNVT